MKKLLVICGPTATGKTALALHLALSFDGELLSVDSRQVYKGMDIGTGKDLPEGARFKISDLRFMNKQIGYYIIKKIRLWGYDLVDAKDDFSVFLYAKIADKIIKNIWKRKKLPILVGGTGFYIKALLDGFTTMQIAKNENLRKKMVKKTTEELFEILRRIDCTRADRMNRSDKRNPRRLIRAIEVAEYYLKNPGRDSGTMIRIIEVNDMDFLFVGFTAPRDYLKRRINLRVDERIKQGFEKEIIGLLKKGVGHKSQAMQSLGYKQFAEYFKKNTSSRSLLKSDQFLWPDNKSERQTAINEWKRAEMQYAKRQMTWFKKEKRVIWFDISKANWRKDIENTVKRWHNNISHDKKS